MVKKCVLVFLCFLFIFGTVESFSQNNGNIIFLTKKNWVEYPVAGAKPDSGNYADSLYVVDLINAGYTVEVPNYDDFKTLGPKQVAALNFADLIILGRGVSSGDFNDADDYLWAKVKKPIILMSNFTARAKRLGWFGSNSQVNITQIDTSFANVENPADPIFAGLNIPANNVIPYTTHALYPLIAHKDSVGINGEVVLSIKGTGAGYGVDLDVGLVRDTIDMADHDNHILMARWAPGVPMYTGVEGVEKAAVPAGYRSYITVGGEAFDYGLNRQVLKYYALTDIMNQIFLREVERLIGLPVPQPLVKENIIFLTKKVWVEYPAAGARPDSGNYADSLYVVDLINAGYNVTVPDYNDFKTVGPEQLLALNRADLVILGRGVSSGDFNDPDDHVWAELTKPIILMSNFTARAKRLGWFGSNSQVNITKIDTSFANVELPDDPIFTGLDIPADNVIPYTTGALYPIVGHKDSVGMNGEVILSIKGIGTGYGVDLDVGIVRDTMDMADYDNHILMARWAPGDSMYSGVAGVEPAAVPAGHRSYVTVGGESFDYDLNRQDLKYYALTNLMNQVFLREVERLLVLPVPEPPVKKQILFLTKKVWVEYPAAGAKPDSGNYADSLYVVDLINAGYEVIVPDYNDYKTLEQAQIDTLIDVDLIILGRGVSSGDFNDPDDYVWEELGTPILLMSNFTARAKRLGWFGSNSQVNITKIDTSFANVELPDDPIFTGLDIPADNVIPYTTGALYPIVGHKDSVGMNGDVLLSIKGVGAGYGVDLDVGIVRDTMDMADYDEHILMARWAPGDSMYSGVAGVEPAAVPVGYRSYVTVGGESFDYDKNRQDLKYYALTDLMNQVWLNEVARMVHLRMPSNITPPVGIAGSAVRPVQYALSQNYPNPFNPVTTIEFSIAKAEQTTIRIYNVMGQEIATLLDKNLTTGSHSVSFDANKYATGLYFYKIESGSFTKVKRMLLLK